MTYSNSNDSNLLCHFSGIVVAISIRPEPEVDRGTKTAENDGDSQEGSDPTASKVETCEVEQGPWLHQPALSLSFAMALQVLISAMAPGKKNQV